MTAALPPVLYHYTLRQFAEDFVERGIISFGSAANYDEDHLTVAQRDPEHIRTAFLTGDKTKLRTGPNYEESVEIKNLISIKFNVKLPPYFLKSMTTTRDDRFFPEFKADTCVVIKSPVELLRKLCLALDDGQLLGDWQVIGDLARYRRDDEIPPVRVEEQFFSKNVGFAWQNEFRIVLVPCFSYTPKSKDARETVHVGALYDICEVV
jgi:hypothetical protein